MNHRIPQGQLKTFLTRIGHGSKFVVTGDLMQSDIKTQNGLDDELGDYLV